MSRSLKPSCCIIFLEEYIATDDIHVTSGRYPNGNEKSFEIEGTLIYLVKS